MNPELLTRIGVAKLDVTFEDYHGGKKPYQRQVPDPQLLSGSAMLHTPALMNVF
ncbi:hypothetical protein [Sinorhizobium fredii]|uniref:hypothetical protein n=1 Tax=Rhizobium fredii TaxID=380 RepID=UPI0035179591